MQPPEDEGFAPQLWMEFATEDIETARLSLPAGLTRSAAFHAQQAAEKGLKALLTALTDDDVPRTHDLLALSALLAERGGTPAPCAGLRELNQHAVMTRYPVAEAPTEDEAADALRLAEELLGFVNGELKRLAGNPVAPTDAHDER